MSVFPQPIAVVFRPSAVMADIKKPISITDKVLKEGSGDVNKLVRLTHILHRVGISLLLQVPLTAVVLTYIFLGRLVLNRASVLVNCSDFCAHYGCLCYLELRVRLVVCI